MSPSFSFRTSIAVVAAAGYGMVGTLTGLQWWIYDSFKTVAGLQASGGSSAPAPKKA